MLAEEARDGRRAVGRAIAYPRAVVAATSKVKNGKVSEATLKDDNARVIDGYRDKLVKYVPVEATAFFALAYGKLGEQIDGDSQSGRWWWSLVLAIGALIAILFAGAGRRDREPFPWYFFVFAALAFLAWAVGTTGIAQEMFPDFLQEANDVVFAAAALVIPGLDQLLTRQKQHATNGSTTAGGTPSAVTPPGGGTPGPQ